MHKKLDCLLLASESNARAKEIWEKPYRRLKELVETEVHSVSIFDGQTRPGC